MPNKKIKLKLENLKIESFVTSLNDDEKKQIIGGVNDDTETMTKQGSLCTVDD
jgi:hypothetical protein